LILIFDDSRNAAFRGRVKAFYDSTLNPRARVAALQAYCFFSRYGRVISFAVLLIASYLDFDRGFLPAEAAGKTNEPARREKAGYR